MLPMKTTGTTMSTMIALWLSSAPFIGKIDGHVPSIWAYAHLNKSSTETCYTVIDSK